MHGERAERPTRPRRGARDLARYAVATAVATLLGGCFTGQRRAQEDEIERYRVGGPTTASTVSRALDASTGAESARRRRERVDADLDASLAKEPTLELVADAVVARNPDAAAALERWVAFLERVPQKTQLPDPTVSYGYSSMFKMHTAGVMQGLPFPTKLVADGEAALADARAMGAEYREARNVLREHAVAAFATLFLVQRELELVSENVTLLDRFVEIARVKYTAGQASESDVLRAEVERDGLKAQRARLARQVEVARSGLNVLLDRDPEAPLGAIKTLPAPTSSIEPGLLDRALESRPALVVARERTNAADARVSRAEQEWIPDLAFGGAYVRDMNMGRDRFELMGGLTLPIWIPKIVAGIREADAERRRSEDEVRSVENRVLDEVKSAQARLAGAAESYAILADDALPKARQNVKASEAAYTSGKIDFLALVDAQRMLLMKELDTEMARAEWVTRRAELERAVGGSAR